MKALFFTLASLVISVQSFAQDAQQKVRYKEEHQKVIFTSGMSKETLETLRKDLKEHALDLTYTDMQFGPTGGLQVIGFKVKDSSGKTGEATSDELRADVFFGFEFGFVDGKSTLINVGTIESDK